MVGITTNMNTHTHTHTHEKIVFLHFFCTIHIYILSYKNSKKSFPLEILEFLKFRSLEGLLGTNLYCFYFTIGS